MTDIIDQAQEVEANHLAQSLHLQAVASASAVRPKATGFCLNSDCEQPFAPSSERLFCGPPCAERYEVTSKSSR